MCMLRASLVVLKSSEYDKLRLITDYASLNIQEHFGSNLHIIFGVVLLAAFVLVLPPGFTMLASCQ